ncbi:MAG: DUF6527 family protein [Sediminibacterium sp.]|uniref:DUF6527 family protein n=1 Tax=Sediminibacterium sp. TaxID=1917865 RepID=UPI00271FC090|nr:DUF6527 family protein [Sediminibacterium sp.]MDO8995561.1 DUF6527 family protein [Sediminibacterium sp.]
MAKAKHYVFDNQNEQVWIYCPGCKTHHAFTTKHPTFAPWQWNGSEQNPTFSPSMLVNKMDPESRCHSFVRDGKIQFLDDCFHGLKNQTVELPEIED